METFQKRGGGEISVGLVQVQVDYCGKKRIVLGQVMVDISTLRRGKRVWLLGR